uniref:Probable purine permease n=1 Tax=Anthurium amnicola TaxID=1678845 RepID=A0A1D1Z6N8_9ARAE
MSSATTAKGMDSLSLSTAMEGKTSRDPPRWVLLSFSCTLLALGGAGPLLLRVYFVHGGKRMWLASLVQVAGWPLALLPLSLSYIRRRRRRRGQPAGLYQMTRPLVAASAGLGLLTGLDFYMYSLGSSYLPVSTSAILSSTQMAFVAGFALLVVRQRFTACSVNAVVVMSLGAVVMGVQAGGDRPAGVSGKQYVLGFLMTVGSAALYGLTLPLMELVYAKAGKKVTYELVMEVQVVVYAFATAFCLVGMLANKDFQAIPREARDYGLGETKYYVVLVADAASWQLYNLGVMGTIACSSSLLAGIVVALLLPASEIAAVLFLHEKFNGGKGVALALSLWGFVSYWYGELQRSSKASQTCEVEVSAP